MNDLSEMINAIGDLMSCTEDKGLKNPCFNVAKSGEFFGRSFKFDWIYGRGRIDQDSPKPLVAGSNPAAATNKYKQASLKQGTSLNPQLTHIFANSAAKEWRG